MKDVITFLASARQVIGTYPQVRSLVCGQGMEREIAALTQMIRSQDLDGHVMRTVAQYAELFENSARL